MNSYKELEGLGSGTLEIDALNLHCQFNGEPIAPLSIAHELHAWLSKDLEQHGILRAEIQEATLSVAVDLVRSPKFQGPQGSFYIGKDGKPIEKGEFFRLAADCKSLVRTDEARYGSARTHKEQWPVGWPEI
ncbi:hypothetical protein [Aquimonas voraii]|uniref:hypothetical protein n=1 Tax=Aquimonas voraii TaxID=265719 RepID=UPI00115FAD01|nr:hypothetical protein [Aquimonas voraii]